MPFTLGSRALSEGYRLAAFDKIGSTNTVALERAREGERGPIWFVAAEQTAGRGRRNRPWIAPRGNLACSVLEVMDISPAAAATVGFVAGLAAETALRQVSVEASLRAPGADDLKFSLKWPNDVLAGARKLVGIGLEAEAVPGEGLAVIAGIGINVISAPEGTPTPATSLSALGVQVGAEELFAALTDSWTEYRAMWDNARGFAEIRKLWLARAAGLGQQVAVRAGGSIVEGTFDTLDAQGCMIVRTATAGLVPITAGDVYFGSAASVRAV